MKAVVAAYHNMGCMGLAALARAGYHIVGVFTHVDDDAENIWFDSVAQWAAARNIAVFSPENINHPIWIEKIIELVPDVFFSFYYRQLIAETILAVPPAGCLNLHGSLLPKYRGRAPVNWVLVNGERETGVTLHHMTSRADAGDIVAQRAVSISYEETAQSLNTKLVKAGEGMLDAVLPLIRRGRAPRFPQNHERASYYPRRRMLDGEIDWSQPAESIRNLIRATTRPYPGAFTHHAGRKLIVWDAVVTRPAKVAQRAGEIVATSPLEVATGRGLLELRYVQLEGDIYRAGADLAQQRKLVAGLRLEESRTSAALRARKSRVLILGVNGFIGNALSERLLESGRYEVHGMDLNDEAIERFQGVRDFHFHEGDIAIHREWIEYHVKKCDVVVPLVAIATPREYTQNPLRVFELDFEENLRVVRYCVKYAKRIVFPSTSEVYGMCADPEFDEDHSQLVLGPIHKQRWIYACAKQLLDRVIWAYGREEGLRFTLFRPFNWIGPRLDNLSSARIGSSRVVTQLFVNLVDGTPIDLIDGGLQKRCFTDVADGIECLFRIIENPGQVCDGQIVNIGNPEGEVSILELAQMLLHQFEASPRRDRFPPFAGMRAIESHRYYGEGYEDVRHRRPSIENARRLLDWQPRVPLVDSVAATLEFFLTEQLSAQVPDMCESRLAGRRVRPAWVQKRR